MLFLQTALPCEARPLISHFGLQGLPAGAPLREWGNGEITLFLSGSGPYAACAATSLALGRGERSPGDLLVSLGTCASPRKGFPPGRLFLATAIRDLASGRAMYPDPVLELGLPEASLLTGARLYADVRAGLPPDLSFDLYDMESAAVYASASAFLGPHRMFFLRVPSDDGEHTRDLTPEAVSRLMEGVLPDLDRTFGRLSLFSRSLESREVRLSADSQAILEEYAPDFRASASMRLQFAQLLMYLQSAGLSCRELLESYRQRGLLPAPGRKEGKERLAECISLLACGALPQDLR